MQAELAYDKARSRPIQIDDMVQRLMRAMDGAGDKIDGYYDIYAGENALE